MQHQEMQVEEVLGEHLALQVHQLEDQVVEVEVEKMVLVQIMQVPQVHVDQEQQVQVQILIHQVLPQTEVAEVVQLTIQVHQVVVVVEDQE